MASWLNLSGIFNAFRLLRDPSLCLPQSTVSTFNHLPIPLSRSFPCREGKDIDIRAVVLDKDNCFAVPHQNEVYASYKDKFQELRKAYPGSRLLIVSNTAGTASDVGYSQAKLLEQNTGIAVLHHNTKKPGCQEDIMKYFETNEDSGVTSPSQIAVVGDRLLTDIMLANMMGSHGIWIKDGVKEYAPVGFPARLEAKLEAFLTRRGYVPPDPCSSFE